MSRRLTLVLATLAVLLWAGLAAVMFTDALPAVATACGTPALDARFTWTIEEAAALMNSCGQTGHDAYVAQQHLDLWYPASLALATVALAAVLSRPGRRVAYVIAGLAILGMAGDYVENAAVRALLAGDGAPAWGPGASLVKNLAGAFALLGLVWLAVGRARRRITRTD